MNSDQIYFHIGYHKTGSTWFQKKLFKDQEFPFLNIIPYRIPFREVLIPRNPINFNKNTFKAFIEERKQDCVDQGKIPIVSDERLVGHPYFGGYDSMIVCDRIKESFPNAKIMIMLRNQFDVILSLYYHYLRDGGTLSLLNFLNINKKVNPSNPGFDPSYYCYSHLIKKYQDVFGKEYVLLLLFEEMVKSPNSFIKRIENFFSVELDHEHITKLLKVKENASLSYRYRLTQRKLNRAFRITNWHEPILPGNSLYKWGMKFNGIIEEKFPIKAKYKEADRQLLHESLFTMYGEDNKQLGQLLDLNLNDYKYPML